MQAVIGQVSGQFQMKTSMRCGIRRFAVTIGALAGTTLTFAQITPTSAPTATGTSSTAIVPASPVTTTVDPNAIKPGDGSITVSTNPTPTKSTIPNSADATWIRISGNTVNVRARADVNSLPMTRLERDSVLWAIRRENGWYAVKPPADVFSLVAAQFIERVGTDRGVVKVGPDSSLRVRAGSRHTTVDPQLTDIQAKLSNGAEVRVMGEWTDSHNDRWLQIAPPEGVLVYVSAEYAEPISEEMAKARGASGTSGAVTHVAGTSTPANATGTPGTTATPISTIVDGTKTTDLIPVSPAGTSGTKGDAKLASDAEIKPISTESSSGSGNVIKTTEIIPVTPGPGTPVTTTGSASTPGIVSTSTPIADSSITTDATSPVITTPTTGSSESTTTLIGPFPSQHGATPENPVFDVEGILQPSWRIPAGQFGLRYKLCNPTNPNLVRGYVEFPFEMKVTPTHYIGKYVGVLGDKYMDTEYEVPIFRTKRLTVLSPDRAVNRPRE